MYSGIQGTLNRSCSLFSKMSLGFFFVIILLNYVTLTVSMHERRRKNFNRRDWASIKEEDLQDERRCLVSDGGRIGQSGSVSTFDPVPRQKSHPISEGSHLWSQEADRWNLEASVPKGRGVSWPFHDHWIRTALALPHHLFFECVRQYSYLLLSKTRVFIKMEEGSINCLFVHPQILMLNPNTPKFLC